MKIQMHTIPLGGTEPIHCASRDCWCNPLLEDAGTLAIHHAQDGREKWERQGITDPALYWGIVIEKMANTEEPRT